MDMAQPPDIIASGPPGVPPPPPPPPPSGRPRDEDRLTRKPMSIWDRIKFLLLLGLVWFILVWSAMANNPLIGFSDAMRIQVRTGWWVFVLIGLELLRQVHFLISEHSAGYHRFWTETVFGGFERTTHRRISDWTRFRIRRILTWILWIAIIAVVTGKIIHTTPILALLRGPQLIWHVLPFVLQIVFAALDRRGPVRRHLLVHVPRRGGRLLPRRHQDQVLRRLGPGPRAPAGQGEHHLPGEPRAGRGARRLRAGRPAAVGAAGNRQDADGRGGGGRDRPPVRVRRPRRLHQHVHGRRHPQGEVALPQAAAARAAVRRRDRLLRRGRLAGQPRPAHAGRRRRRARQRHPRAVRARRLSRVFLPVRRHPVAADPAGDGIRRSPTTRAPGGTGR